jgi:hypothetical protein
MADIKQFILRSSEIKQREQSFSHPWNSKSQLIGVQLSRALEVGLGDFMAFPAPSVPHHLKNPFDQELLYLMGGENRKFDIADFPRLGKRIVKSGEKIEVYDISSAKPFGP